MSEEFTFDIDDVGTESDEQEEVDIQGMIANTFSYTGLLSLPLSVLAIYTFLEKSAVIAALTPLFGGSSTISTIVGTALWASGGIIVGLIGVVVFTVALLLFVGAIQRDTVKFSIGLLGALYIAIVSGISIYFFGYLPLLVAFSIVSTLVAWGGLLVVGLAGIVFGIVSS